jgi:hypothetical protein
MYRIRSISADQWTIVNESDRVMFIGAMQQCEDWLDYAENHGGMEHAPGWFQRLCEWLHLRPAGAAAASRGPRSLMPPRLAS